MTARRPAGLTEEGSETMVELAFADLDDLRDALDRSGLDGLKRDLTLEAVGEVARYRGYADAVAIADEDETPGIQPHEVRRLIDENPQSALGKAIATVQPANGSVGLDDAVANADELKDLIAAAAAHEANGLLVERLKDRFAQQYDLSDDAAAAMAESLEDLWKFDGLQPKAAYAVTAAALDPDADVDRYGLVGVLPADTHADVRQVVAEHDTSAMHERFRQIAESARAWQAEMDEPATP